MSHRSFLMLSRGNGKGLAAPSTVLGNKQYDVVSYAPRSHIITFCYSQKPFKTNELTLASSNGHMPNTPEIRPKNA